MPRGTTVAKKAASAPASPPETDEDDDLFGDLSEDDHVKVLLYGKEGSTKTTSGAKMSAFGKILVINAEGGLKKIPLRKRGANLDNIVVYPRRGQTLTRTGLAAVLRKVEADLMENPNSWYGIFLDSATEVTQIILGVAQKKRIKTNVNAGKVGAAVDPDFIDIADYGTMSKMVREILRTLRDIPCHVVISALERRDIDKDTGKPAYGPAISPALATDMMGYVDLVLMLKAPDEDGPARALCKANSRYRAKDRFDVLPRVLAEPSWDRIVGYVTGELTEETDPIQKSLSATAKKSQDKAEDVDLEAEDDDEEDED